MQWRPSTSFDTREKTELWSVLEQIFDRTVSFAPLSRGDANVLRNSYVRRRRNDSPYLASLRSLLPSRLGDALLGSTEIELITFILEQTDNRILNVEGRRGVGKTTLLHYVESMIQEARLSTTPALLMLDGRELRSADVVTDASYLRLLCDELAHPRTTFDPALREPLQRFAAKLLKRTSDADVSRIARALAKDLPNNDTRLVTLLFDNLDQLSGDAIRAAADLARSVYYASGIGSVLCLRPGSTRSLMQTTSARALFSWIAIVEPPAVDAWLDRLAERMRNTCKNTAAPLGQLARSRLPVTPELVFEVMQRVADYLKSTSHRRRSMIGVLDGMAGGDLRQLSWLIRNLLSHRDLPEDYLLRGGDEPSFRPINAILEGENVVFRSRRGEGRVPIPNLLWYRTANGTIDLLLYHRILTLLDDYPIDTIELLDWLVVLGHQRVDGIGAIAELASAGLIGMTDREQLIVGQIPEQVFMMRAGYYYRDHLIADADYLLVVIADVPLEHRAMRHGTEPLYSQRLTSLAEYAQRLVTEERLQLGHIEAHMERQDSGATIDRLVRGGFLSEQIINTLSQSIERVGRSTAPRLAQTAAELAPLLSDLRARLAERLYNLNELRASIRLRTPLQPLKGVSVTTPGMQVEVRPERLGDAIELHADIHSAKGVPAAFVAFCAEEAGKTVGQATLVNLVRENHQRLHGKFPIRTTDAQLSAKTSVQAVALPANTRRVGLLSVNVENDRFVLHLFVYSDGRTEGRTLGIGEEVSVTTKWVRGEIAAVSEIVTAGKPFDAAIRTIGVELCRRVCGTTGAEILAAYYLLIDTLVIFSNHLDVPWEWLCIPPRRGQPDLPAIAIRWRVVRWPWDRIHGTALTLTRGFDDGPVERLGTIGIASNGRPKWRIPVPNALQRFRTAAERYDALHVVGHWDTEKQALELGRLVIKADGARAFAPVGPRHIIVSACDVATTEHSANVAIAFSEAAGCTSWAPLVKVRRDDVLAFDRELAAYLERSDQNGIDGFMRAHTPVMPFLLLYARYGICAE